MTDTALAVQPPHGTPGPTTIEGLLALAIERGTPIDVMERLLAMSREVKADRAKEAYITAMSAFQAECPVIVKSKSGPNDSYRYAPLDRIVATVGPLLGKHGLSYSFDTRDDDNAGEIVIVCIVTHIAGHSESKHCRFPLLKGTSMMSAPQVYAATLTYGKRYTFCNALGILTGDTDTDSVPPPERKPVVNRRPAGSVVDVAPEPQGYVPTRDDLTGPLPDGYMLDGVVYNPPLVGARQVYLEQQNIAHVLAQGAALDAKHGKARSASKGPLLTGAWITVELSSGSRQMVMPPGHKEKLACYSWYAAAADGTGETIQTYHQNKPREACGDVPETYIGPVDVKLKRSGDYCMIADMRAVQDEPARGADGELL